MARGPEIPARTRETDGMRSILSRGAGLACLAIVAMLTVIWFLRTPSDDVIPAEFRGAWLDQGAECQDIDAQARITASTIDYDHLSFKVASLAEAGEDTVSITGESCPLGRAVRETVKLQMLDHRTKIVIIGPDLAHRESLFRCSALGG